MNSRETTEIFPDFSQAREMLRELQKNPAEALDYHVYQYSHLDMLQFMPPASLVLKDFENANEILANLEKAFGKKYWDGDGEIGVLWLPPFVDLPWEDSYGHLVWVVKQDNNGFSFIASKYALRFPRLLEQQ